MRTLYSFLLLGTLLVSPLAQAELSCEELLSLLFLDPQQAAQRPEWQQLLSRNGEIHDNHYAGNITLATVNVFAAWFESDSDLNFKEMLQQMHKSAIHGANHTDVYISPVARAHERLVAEQVPGVFRHVPSAWDPIVSDSHLALKQRILENEHPDLQFFKQFSATTDANAYVGRRTKIEGMPEEALPEVTNVNQETIDGRTTMVLLHRYPAKNNVPVYLTQMEIVMKQIREKKYTSTEQLIHHLARYHQLFAVGLPFRFVNNSIAMAQINFILLQHGLNGIMHGRLDYLAHLLPTSQYQAYFLGAVQRANPQLKDPKRDLPLNADF